MSYTKEQLDRMLETRWYCNDLRREVSIREYFYELLATLWKEGEGFSGKRPFGNSGWDADLAFPLVQGGYLRGRITIEDGWTSLDSYDGEAHHKLVAELIKHVFFGSKDGTT